MMSTILLAIFMILLTGVMYVLAKKFQQKINHPLLNPALIASCGVILFLLIFHISYNEYMIGGQWIYKFLDCTVVALAYPLYKTRHTIARHFKVVFLSVMAGIIANFTLIYCSLKLFGFDKEMIATVLPKSITAAVGIQVSNQLGGIDTLTVVLIIATGLVGSIVGPYLLRIGQFNSPIARGLTYGNSAHAFGTSKALEMGEEDGAFSSVGMILTALLSSILIPIGLLVLY
jgi:predicted murein hydrolase (TIGR00659 family)